MSVAWWCLWLDFYDHGLDECVSVWWVKEGGIDVNLMKHVGQQELKLFNRVVVERKRFQKLLNDCYFWKH